MTINPNVIIADWQPVNGTNEYVGVYSALSKSSNEYLLWDAVINHIDALIDKDFSYTSSAAAKLTISHVNLGSGGTLANADYFDEDPNNQSFDIGVHAAAIRAVASENRYNYLDYYHYIAEHELGHALGLKHPFDSDNGSLPSNSSLTSDDTVLAYGFTNQSFTPLDIAALITVNGIEDDTVNGETPVYRFYNRVNGGHFFTASAAEAEFVATKLYDYYDLDGTAFYAGEVAMANTESLAVYRFFNAQTGGHFFTANVDERNFVQQSLSANYQYEGVGFYASATDTAFSDPVYRFYNEASGSHFYTSSAEERDYAINTLHTFDYEGVAFYA